MGDFPTTTPEPVEAIWDTNDEFVEGEWTIEYIWLWLGLIFALIYFSLILLSWCFAGYVLCSRRRRKNRAKREQQRLQEERERNRDNKDVQT